mgnify:CR=1 FL=1
MLFQFLVLCLKFRELLASVEFGRVTLEGTDSSGDGIPTRVDFQNSLIDPVVIPTIATRNDLRSIVCRMYNLDSSGFNLTLEATSQAGQTANHSPEEVCYFAVDIAQLPDSMQAGKLNISDGNWNSVTFDSAFTEAPVVLAFVQTMNNILVNIRMKNVNSTGFEVVLDELSRADGVGDTIPNEEIVGWLAIPEGVYEFEPRSEFRIEDSVTHERTSITTSESFTDSHVFVATISTFEGPEGLHPRGYKTSTSNQIWIYVEENQLVDEEQKHRSEVVSWAAFYTCCYTYGLFQGFCPTGFSRDSENCTKEESLVFHMTLNQINDTIQEQARGMEIYTGEDSSFYPEYRTTDPWAAYKRGYYFSGSSYMKFPDYFESEFTFAPEFTITAWVRPDSNSNQEVLLSKEDRTSGKTMLEFSLDSGNPKLKLFLKNSEVFEFNSTDSIVPKTWNFLWAKVYINSDSNLEVELGTNLNTQSGSNASSWYSDLNSDYKMTLGAKWNLNSYQNFYEGFLYELRIYNENFDASSLAVQACSGSCEVCPNDGDCILSCDIDEFWTGTDYDSCDTCDPSCSYGCLRPGDCSLCEDELCEECSNFDTCLSCKGNSTDHSGACECDAGYFQQDYGCAECGSNCTRCSSPEVCLECSDDYYLLDTSCYDKCGFCSNCDANNTCLECVNNAEKNQQGGCQCVENSTEDQNGDCVCNQGLLSIAGGCYQPCGNFCADCDYENGNCNKCVSNAQENADGVCECLEGFEIGSSGDSCHQECNDLCSNCVDGKCNQCATLSYLKFENICECVDKAFQEPDALECTCNSGYKSVSGKCLQCKNYFQPSEVSAHFSEKYTKILVGFSAESSTSFSSCQYLIDESSLEKLGQNPKCTWKNSTMMVVSLGSNFTIREEPLKLNAFNIVKKEGECSFDHFNLEPVAEYKYPLPTISAKLSAPYSYSIACATKSLQISAEKSTGRAGGSLSYQWSQLSGPSSIDLSTQTGSVLSIPKTQLSGGNYTFSVFISNNFDRSDSEEISVEVEEAETLSVEIDAGNQISIKSGDSLKIKAFVESFCGKSSSVQYAWNYEGLSNGEEAPGNPSGVIGNSKQSHVLRIKEGDLQAGYTYIFKATAQEGESYGEAFLYVTVESSPLVAALKKADGQISNGKDLQLDANKSYDPDNSEGSLEFEWTCTEPSKNYCESTSGEQLLDTEQTGSILQIESEKLRPGAFYYFCVKVSKDTREAEKCVELEVVEMGSREIEIPNPLFKINHQWEVLILLSVQGSLEDSVQWNQVLGPSLTPTTPVSNPYVYFSPNSMALGSYYSWQATLSTPGGSSLAMTISWNTNVGPSCLGDLEVSPSTGSALSTDFELSILDCFDGDEEDYPLFYSFGLVRNGFYIPLAPPRLSNKVITKLLPGTNTLFAMVCDSMWSCEYYMRTFAVGSVSRRRLEEKSVSQAFLEDTKDPELIPGTVLMYCESLELEQEAITTMLSKLKEFSQNLEDIDEATYSNTIGAISAMASEENTNESQTVQLVDLALYMLNFELEILEKDAQLLMDSAKSLTQKFSLNNRVLKKSQELISKVFNRYFKNSTPGDQPRTIDLDKITTYRMTETPENFKNTTLDILDSNLTLPESLPFSNNDVVDIELTSYKQAGNYSDIVDLSFFKGGSYSGFNLDLQDRSLYSLNNLTEPITIEIPFHNNIGNWSCGYLKDEEWVEEGCQISEVRSNSVIINVTHTSTFSLQPKKVDSVVTAEEETKQPLPKNSEEGCSKSFYPLYMLSILFVLGIVLAFKFSKTDKVKEQSAVVPVKDITFTNNEDSYVHTTNNEKVSEEENGVPEAIKTELQKSKTFMQNHLTFGLFVKDTPSRGLYSALLAMEFMVLGALIGGAMWLLEDTDSEDKDLFDLSFEEAKTLLLAMGICLVFMGVIEVVLKLARSKGSVIGVTVGCLIIGGVALGFSGYLCSEFCGVWSQIWACMCLSGVALEVLLSQTLRALLKFLIFK